MSAEQPPSANISATIGDVNQGQVAVGIGNTQTNVASGGAGGATAADLAQLHELLASLAGQVEADAPPEKKDAALERVGELSEALTAEAPDVTTVEYVKNWFSKHLPKLAGVVAGVLVNPVIGTVVAAAGEGIADDYRRRVGSV
jgi:hypothetical protein